MHQTPHAVAHEQPIVVDGVHGESVGREHGIAGIRDVGERIEQGAVQVKHHGLCIHENLPVSISKSPTVGINGGPCMVDDRRSVQQGATCVHCLSSR